MLKGKEFLAWSDGSCDNKNPNKPGGAAYIITDMNGNVIKRKSKGFLHTTNNRMEQLAIISIINSLPFGSSVTIYTDSRYCITALNSQKPKKNLDQIALYHKICKEKHLSVYFQHVKGHSGNKYNEECDKMARKEYNNINNKISKPSEEEKQNIFTNKFDELYYSQITTKGRRKKIKKK
jgi:ribonuclease HI